MIITGNCIILDDQDNLIMESCIQIEQRAQVYLFFKLVERKFTKV